MFKYEGFNVPDNVTDILRSSRNIGGKRCFTVIGDGGSRLSLPLYVDNLETDPSILPSILEECKRYIDEFNHFHDKEE